MSEGQQVIRLVGLQRLDEHELQNSLPAESVRFERAESVSRPGTSYEPFTAIAVVILTVGAVKGLSAWLLKRRHQEEVEIQVERHKADGSWTKESVHFKMSDSSTEADVVKAIGDKLGVDPAIISSALSAATA